MMRWVLTLTQFLHPEPEFPLQVFWGLRWRGLRSTLSLLAPDWLAFAIRSSVANAFYLGLVLVQMTSSDLVSMEIC